MRFLQTVYHRLLQSAYYRLRNAWPPGSDLPDIKALECVLSDAQIARIIDEVRPYTMVHVDGVDFAVRCALDVVAQAMPGALVECGVWRGGCSLAMLLAQRAAFGEVRRPVYMLDSFEGLPPAEDKDGRLALEWQQGNTETFFNNCAATEDEVRTTLEGFGFRDGDFHLVKGWFDETVPAFSRQIADDGIALLRLDGDWYKSTYVCLEHLEPLVPVNGFVAIDDYYAWDGCARAVHDYLSAKDFPYRIKSLPYNLGAYFVKRPFRERYDEY